MFVCDYKSADCLFVVCIALISDNYRLLFDPISKLVCFK